MVYRFPVVEGDRVAIAPHTDEWVSGLRFGRVLAVSVNEENQRRYSVQFDARTVRWFGPDDILGAVNAAPGVSGHGEQDYPPLRAVASWDGTDTVMTCDTCGCRGVDHRHVPGDEVCRMLRTERFQKHAVSGDE